MAKGTETKYWLKGLITSEIFVMAIQDDVEISKAWNLPGENLPRRGWWRCQEEPKDQILRTTVYLISGGVEFQHKLLNTTSMKQAVCKSCTEGAIFVLSGPRSAMPTSVSTY